MKKTMRFLALALAAVILSSLLSCGTIEVKPFTRGTVDGDVYTSEFLGITFTKPSSWTFYDDEQIAALIGTTIEQMPDSDSFREASEGEVMDFFASNAASSCNINLTFDKGGIFTSFSKSIDATVQQLKTSYESMGWTVTVSEPSDTKLGSLECRMITADVSFAGGTMQQYCYFTMIGNYFAVITCTTGTGMTAAEFEAMFS